MKSILNKVAGIEPINEDWQIVSKVNPLTSTLLIKTLFKVLKTCAFLSTSTFLCFPEQAFSRTTLLLPYTSKEVMGKY